MTSLIQNYVLRRNPNKANAAIPNKPNVAGEDTATETEDVLVSKVIGAGIGANGSDGSDGSDGALNEASSKPTEVKPLSRVSNSKLATK
jgi:hypothetical protein